MIYGLIEVLDNIYDYYKKTLEYTREVALGLESKFITLYENYPYYDDGLRGIEIIEGVMGDYYNNRFYMNVYCDLNLLNSKIYQYLTLSNEVDKIYVVSNTLNLAYDIKYKDDIYFLCDMSKINMTYSPYIPLSFEFNQFKNLVESNINMSLNYFFINYDIPIEDIECNLIDPKVEDLKLINLTYETNGVHFTNFKFDSVSENSYVVESSATVSLYLHFFFNNTSCSYEMLLDYINKLLYKLHKQKNLIIKLYLDCKDYKFVIEKTDDIRNCHCDDILDYEDFTFLHKYEKKYKKIDLNLRFI